MFLFLVKVFLIFRLMQKIRKGRIDLSKIKEHPLFWLGYHEFNFLKNTILFHKRLV